MDDPPIRLYWKVRGGTASILLVANVPLTAPEERGGANATDRLRDDVGKGFPCRVGEDQYTRAAVVPPGRQGGDMDGRIGRREMIVGGAAALAYPGAMADGGRFEGKFLSGEGDAGYLALLDTCYSMLWPNGALQNLSMLYSPVWNGFVEGPTWGAWWIQNSYGPTYCGLPFFTEPYRTFVQNAQDLWFDQMGDGKRKGVHDWVAPDGCLCDAAAPNWIVYKQGDGNIGIHDWGVEFTAAGIVMQAELLLISRDRTAIERYLPLLERCAAFVESRRDPKNNLFLAGPAGNLLAPSYAGYRRPDGTYGMGYLTGLSVTCIAALDRLSELERLAGRPVQAGRYADRAKRARRGLSNVTTDKGYLIKALDPDGTRHGVFGAPKHGYFEAVCNHDAIAFNVVPEDQARRIYATMDSIAGLRPHGVVITNYPSLDDMYAEPTGLWQFGTWVNGGHWTTCEARMLLADLRMGGYAAARRSVEHIMTFARVFRTDNPLVQFGAAVYQSQHPINCVYDTWGAPLGMLRGLFEYRYGAETLTLVPHIPPEIMRLEQRFPVVWGRKRLYLDVRGQGVIRSVLVNGERWTDCDNRQVRLRYDALPDLARVRIVRDGSRSGRSARLLLPPCDLARNTGKGLPSFAVIPADDKNGGDLHAAFERVKRFHDAMRRSGLDETYFGTHAALILSYGKAMRERIELRAAGRLPDLPEASAHAADSSYTEAVGRLVDGLKADLERQRDGKAPDAARVFSLWQKSK